MNSTAPLTTVLIVLASILSFSCVSTTPRTDDHKEISHVKANPAEQPAEDEKPGFDLPELELDTALTYELLAAEFARTSGDYGLASEIYLNNARKTKDPRLAKSAAQMAIYSKDYDTAEIAAYFWVSIAPDHPDANQSYASLLIQRNELESAEPYIRKVMHHTDTDKDRGYAILANMLLKAKDKERALDLMDRIAGDDRQSVALLYASAQLASQFGMVEETEQRLDQLLSLEPTHRNAIMMRSRVYFQQGDIKRALELALEGVELHPNDFDLRLFYGRLLVNNKQYKEGLIQFRILNKQKQDNLEIRYSLGLLAVQVKAFDEAEIHFLTLIENDQHYASESRQAMAQIAEMRGDKQSAINWYKSVPYSEHYYVSQYKAAQLIVLLDGIEAAIKHLDSLEYQDEDDTFKGYLLKGELYQSNNIYEKAYSEFTQGLALKPNDTSILYDHAMSAQSLGRLDIMEKDIKHLLTIDPNHVAALNALGYTLADQTKRYQEAYDYIKKAYELKPDDAAILDSMGWVLYRLGKTHEAVKYLRQAASKNEDGEISAHLGEVLWALGEKKDAKTVWENALKFAPKHPILLKTIKNHNP